MWRASVFHISIFRFFYCLILSNIRGCTDVNSIKFADKRKLFCNSVAEGLRECSRFYWLALITIVVFFKIKARNFQNFKISSTYLWYAWMVPFCISFSIISCPNKYQKMLANDDDSLPPILTPVVCQKAI